jgi:hypothetical protein
MKIHMVIAHKNPPVLIASFIVLAYLKSLSMNSSRSLRIFLNLITSLSSDLFDIDFSIFNDHFQYWIILGIDR